MTKRKLTRADLFKAAQQPINWYRSAERLMMAAEIILSDQLEREIPYFSAVENANIRAIDAAAKSPDGSGGADIEADPPNYLPAQLLYAFAIENALKGLAVARDADLVGASKLNTEIKIHDLLRLAEKAAFRVMRQEEPILRALSQIAIWAGRYPVAGKLNEYLSPQHLPGEDPHQLLDWGTQHPIMRSCFARLMQDLEAALRGPRHRFGRIVVLPPGVSASSG